MTSNEIRKQFLDFFENRGHRVVPSSSLVPANDPTLLFTNAGMNQFKDVFLGREKRDYARACSSQKCVRAGGKHNDLEQVGRTTRHHTFFEMLGNFSFGDYFKKEAIPWAWELITKDFAIPREKLYVTTFLGSGSGPEDHDVVPRDDEAHDLWVAQGVSEDRIFKLGLKDNFWQMGDTGPCGPCSEIHYDLEDPKASELGHSDCKFPCDCGRYVELWNLVFMQYNRYCRYERDGYPSDWDQKARADHKHSDDRFACLALDLLPRPSIDTGAGLERLAAVLQGKVSNFDTDLFRPLIDEAASLTNAEYGSNHETDVSLRIIADHARAATFLISDGVLPSNEGRGYVLRLIIRRALYHGQTLGLNEPFLFKLSGTVVDMIKGAYPELAETAHHVAKAISVEEERYAHTTRIGLERLKESCVVVNLPDVTVASHVRELAFEKWQEWFSDHGGDLAKLFATLSGPMQLVLTKESKRPAPQPGGMWIPGDELFKLHDSFGLRPDFVADIVKNYGLAVDWDGYQAEMRKQRERARASWKAIEKSLAKPAYSELAKTHRTQFLGYDTTNADDCKVVAIIERGTDRSVQETTPGVGPVEHEIVLDKTPFYAEAGGQVGDTGWLLVEGEHVARVEDTYSPMTGIIAHYIRPVSQRGLRLGDKITAQVDAERRDLIRRNHTATHLLHAALRKTLGTHVKQAGSLVAPHRLRFDFTHYVGLDEQDLLDIEDLVNEHILKDEAVVPVEMPYDEALNSGAMALFQEDYVGRKMLRVVSIVDGSFSKELCGGTHVDRTGQIGLFKVVSESSVAAGTRRIEAITGKAALERFRKAEALARGFRTRIRIEEESEASLLSFAKRLIEDYEKQVERSNQEIREARKKIALEAMAKGNSEVRLVKGVKVMVSRVQDVDRQQLREILDKLRQEIGSGVLVFGSMA